MKSHYFNNERQVGSAITLAGAQETLHAVYHAMQSMPYYHHPIVQYYHHPMYFIHQDIYPADFSTIPFGPIYYL
ncbi:DUF3947 family protein [Bacillus sp. DX1.1]|uniref:DUF3947 family protein n=1 Tax=unclassified Bacillus (in: firmicutes) TaxID=185979 RepID=UPI0025701744|nr:MULTISPECIES: DUF3947 family protein [unclassified Bacillus (in: firmicutes)]MDM5156594.1 DUF3947 family protein [Bacillus sp. DX1.1]WJE80854.1 DUF3947 family protein [Bacillus sp. DX3.1]